MTEIWFWQQIVSPHMASLAVALACDGCKVTYVAEQAMSEDRASQGWTPPDLPGVELLYSSTDLAADALANAASLKVTHICQGVRANGLVGVAQRTLAKRGARQWVIMETVDDAAWYGALKRAVYRQLFHSRKASLQGVLAVGHRTAEWLVARGVQADSVFSFAYFLPDGESIGEDLSTELRPFRFVFAGRLIPLKRVDWLIKALSELTDQSFELCILGSGPVESALRDLAITRELAHVDWRGQLPQVEVPGFLAQCDCLVLPSVYDGWGAVASEALMSGTPVVCSDACGVAGAVQSSGMGGVFPAHDRDALVQLLSQQLARGRIAPATRTELKAWASCLGATAGASYLKKILTYGFGQVARPVPPWLASTAGAQ